MKTALPLALAILAACSAAVGAGDDPAAAQAPLVLVRTAVLPGVDGRIDHLALDAKRQTLHVAALGNGSLEVVSLAKSERTQSVGGLPEPQGVEFLPRADRVAVACGGDGSVRFLDARSLETKATTDLGSDADNAHADAAGDLWVAFGSGGIARIDAGTAKETARVPLGAHPEGFAIEVQGKRIFVNLASRGEVAVVDREAGKVVARWKPGASSNYPMALDEAAGRLYVGCRSPARLVVLATDDGRVLASPECSGDPDDVFVDAGRKRAYVACGAGSIDVFDLAGAEPKLLARVPTERGARTMLLDAATGTVHLAVPRRGAKDAEVRTYEPR